MVGNGGLLTASGTTFNGSCQLTPPRSSSTPAASSSASNSTFALSQRRPEHGSILNAGDLVGDSFNCPLYLPEVDVQYLSGTGSNNAQFQDIDILAGSVASGQTLALNAIGTASTANLRYVFPGNFTVSQRGHLSRAPPTSACWSRRARR